MFEQFLGRNQGNGFSDPLTREACAHWLGRVLGYYSDDARQVDIGIIEGQLPLTAQTAPYIYSTFTPPTVSYRPGTRPLLEEVVASVVRPGMSDRDKALALLRRCRDNARFGSTPDPGAFCGGSEEELLKRGATMCNEISRVFACLANVAGLPARIYSAHITGHMMNEVFIEGRWWWLDVMKGIYAFNADGTPASAWDLLRDSTLLERQTRATWADFGSWDRPFSVDHPRGRQLNIAYWQARFRDCYFNPREAAAIGNYGVADTGRFTTPWRCKGANPALEADARHKLALVTKKLGWPDYYWDFKLFDGELKVRD